MISVIISIIDCPCGNPKPHKKFEVKIEGESYFSEGFFTIAEGRLILSELLAAGYISNSDITAIEPDLVSCGLEKSETHSEDELKILAIALATKATSEVREEILAVTLQSGVLSEEELKYVRTIITELLRYRPPSNWRG